MCDTPSNGIGITSQFGDMQVVVFMPGQYSQSAYGFRPQAPDNGLEGVARRDLAVIRAMLQDALDDVDDERHRRLRDETAAAHGLPPQVVAPRPAPGHGPGTW